MYNELKKELTDCTWVVKLFLTAINTTADMSARFLTERTFELLSTAYLFQYTVSAKTPLAKCVL